MRVKSYGDERGETEPREEKGIQVHKSSRNPIKGEGNKKCVDEKE